MIPISIVCLFCEDIREEKSNQDILIGILPQNMSVPSVPGQLSKLAMYIRVNCDILDVPKTLRFRLSAPGVPENFPIGTVDGAILHQGKEEAAALKSPLVGYIIKAIMSPFPIPEAGQIIVTAEVDGEDRPCGVLNITMLPAVTTVTATSG